MRTSVVIGFRNWGAGRIELAGRSILDSLAGMDGELVISDYGSDEVGEVREVARRLGAVHVHTDVQGPWSRSRALNAGFAVATGDLLVSTDADMLFSPGSFPRIAELASAGADNALFLQCRDLPEGVDDAWVREHGTPWDRLERMSRLRPRWGMGGMMAISRAGFERIRGFDERFHTYGGEDLDFAQRAARAGHRIVWVDDPAVRMYHMWHPSSRVAADATPEGRRAVEANRTMLRQDPSFMRNTTAWEHPLAGTAPLVTVAIATQGRGAMLAETVRSALAQSVQDLEVLVVGDGVVDDTEQVLAAFGDERVRYLRQDAAGISAARNLALDHSRGRYTAVIDDDDLMHPDRLAWQLAAVTGGAAGSVGSFVNFDDTTGEMQVITSTKPMRETAAPQGAAPGHGTWLVRTDVLRRFRYDETITSGVDNNLLLRMLRAGVHLVHTGRPLLLRRMHEGQVTVQDGGNQKAAAVQALGFLRFGMTEETLTAYAAILEEEGPYAPSAGRSAMLQALRPYLPDHLVRRAVQVRTAPGAAARFAAVAEGLEGRASQDHRTVDGLPVRSTAVVEDATWADLVALRRAGLDWTVLSSTLRRGDDAAAPGDSPAPASDAAEALDWVAELLADPALAGAGWTHACVSAPLPADAPAAPAGALDDTGRTHVLSRSMDGRRTAVVVRLHGSLEEALAAGEAHGDRAVLERPDAAASADPEGIPA